MVLIPLPDMSVPSRLMRMRMPMLSAPRGRRPNLNEPSSDCHVAVTSYAGTGRSGFEKRTARSLPRLDVPNQIRQTTTEESDMATKTTNTQAGDAAGWTDDERAAMREHAAELKRAGGKGAAKAAEEAQACLDKIAEMPDSDRVVAERIHAIVTGTAPGLTVRTWYGMPAYALDGKVVCFFKPSVKFKMRYSTLGFSDTASLDEGTMWPTEFAVTSLTKADEKRIAALVTKAIG